MERRNFTRMQRVVVKIGSSSLTYPTGKLNIEQIEQLVRQLADLHNRGMDVLLVTSGAVGAGMGKLGLARRPRTIPEKQAAAAVGQGILLHMYEKIFAEYGVIVGQVLLTREDFADRRRFLNARNTLQAMLGFHIIPVINENDTVAVDEIKLGDNDNLAAMVAGLVDADLVVLLSDVDGLFDGRPGDPGATLVKEIREIDDRIEALAGGVGSAVGTGGMATKIQAARIAMHSGVVTIIARASERDVIRRLVAGEPLGTVFWPSVRLVNKKRWIAYGATVCGRIYIDGGAARALRENGKSLLPSGVTGVEGDFEMGNTVSVVAPDGKEIARGIVNYSAAEVERIKGRKTGEIEKILGYKDYDEIIHRDNLALE
ncbi:glutamate 5-kinase [Desulfallas sp. Bu1-1]|jgi:glutamate 5-kinase|uniref:glutamate 5-kinase n=1 Tax=Desulfallas sp. Bu1-1 TaxID=2787620 RepID=UPI0018A0B1FF|nr:glutamate 5-kinase [Desulfallas sp. Bu1-1]MBF7083700.1 glutamate 5-kinase [Desulfallas sp. Bu1-1]